MTTVSAPETVPIPASHLDLLTRPICGVLTTAGGDGQPQSSLVWVDVDGDGVCARVNTTLERQKGRNLVANPKVSLLVVDPDNTARYLQVRGDAELVTDGALAHLDALTRSYTRTPPITATSTRPPSVGARGGSSAGSMPGGSPWTPSMPEPEQDRRPSAGCAAHQGPPATASQSTVARL
jgi:PPOX class probable F420-dependent enzyme